MNEALKKEYLTRQQDVVPYRILKTPIAIVGAGAIGSFSALALAKMGFDNIFVVDFDTVDTVNMNAQFFRYSDIGKPKVEALRDLIKDFTGVEIKISNAMYSGGKFGAPIVISAVDSMKVRKLIWEQHKDTECFVIDPRMSAEYAALYVAEGAAAIKKDRYDKSLYSDASAVQERCTAKATIYTALNVSGLVVKAVKDCLTGTQFHQVQWDIGRDDFVCFRDKAISDAIPPRN